DRPPDHFHDRPAAVRQEALPDPVQRGGQEVGAVRGVGRGDQWRVRPAGPPEQGGDHHRVGPLSGTRVTWKMWRLPMLMFAATLTLALVASGAAADPLTCNLIGYKAAPGLTAANSDNTLAVTWAGDKDHELRMRLGGVSGTPTIRELAVRKKGGQWATLVTNVTPEFR